MPDIFHNFPINAKRSEVFRAVSTPDGLNNWWTKTCAGKPSEGSAYQMGFGPEYNWQAIVSRCDSDSEFEFQFTEADSDWTGTRIGFLLTENNGNTDVSFRHVGWPESNEHYRTSCFCWAMYLRLMKRYVETGEVVPYEVRLDV